MTDRLNTVFASPIGDQYLIYRRPIFCRLVSVDKFVDDVIERIVIIMLFRQLHHRQICQLKPIGKILIADYPSSRDPSSRE